MTSAGIYHGSCLRWAVRYLLRCYCMGLDMSLRLPLLSRSQSERFFPVGRFR
jgi:hypothetical protein